MELRCSPSLANGNQTEANLLIGDTFCPNRFETNRWSVPPRPSSSSIDFVSMLRRSNIFPLFAVDEEVACVCRATMEEIKRKNRPTTVFPPPARFIICSCWFSQILNMPIQTHPLWSLVSKWNNVEMENWLQRIQKSNTLVAKQTLTHTLWLCLGEHIWHFATEEKYKYNNRVWTNTKQENKKSEHTHISL